MELYSPLGFLPKWYTRIRLIMSPLDEVAEMCPEKANIVDLGCGNGLFAHLLRLGSDQREIRASDLDAHRVEIARKTAQGLGGLSFEVKNALEADLAGADCITVVDLVHHMPWELQEQLFERVARALPPGGLLIFKDLDRRPLWKYVFHYFQDSISYRGGKLYFRASEEWKRILEGHGLRVEIIPPKRWFPYPHVTLKCVKQASDKVEA